MSDLPLSHPVFTILSSLVEERIGVAYSSSDKEIFASKVGTRAVEAGFESLLDYYYYLRYDDPEQIEFKALSEALLVHETYFFRELDPLRVAIDQLLAPLVLAGERVRIWCSACSTGEEPWTLAMLLAERGLLDQVELIATDLSEAVLERARAGRYSVRALRHHVNHPLAKRYLHRAENELTVSPELLGKVDFRRLNLLDAEQVGALGTFQLIACRNVLIYFRDERAREVLQHLTERLVQDGTLLVGVSESLMRFGGALQCEEHGGVFMYRKRSGP